MNPVEQLHFRLDENERKLAALGSAQPQPEAIAMMVQGAIAALHASLQTEIRNMMGAHALGIDRVLAAITADAETDRKVIEAVDRLISTMAKPSTRTGVIDLPSGPVRMTVTEARN